MVAEPQEHHILVVDDDEIILIALSETLRHAGYVVTTTTSPAEALASMKQRIYAVIISDQRMNEMTGLEFLERSAKLQPNASRILITGVLTLKTVIAAINTGEIFRFVAKPWLREDLLATVKNAVQRHQLLEINRKLQEDTLKLNEQLSQTNAQLQEKVRQLTHKGSELDRAHWALQQNFTHSLELVHRIISAYHPILGQETKEVADLCEKMLQNAPFDEKEKHVLTVSSWLHNIGLIGISRELYTKAREAPEELTPGERAMLEHHPIYGQTLAAFVDELEEVGETIRASHERWNGSGYPDQLSGENIPFVARYLAVVIHFVESIKPREETIDEILRNSGTWFEPEAVRLFLKATRMIQLPRKVREVLFSELVVGMVLAKGIYSPTDLLLIPEGHTLTEKSLTMLREHNQATPVQQRLLVYI